jgi:hypothetical protein
MSSKAIPEVVMVGIFPIGVVATWRKTRHKDIFI